MKRSGRRPKRARQLALTEQRLEIPRWESLPMECKREVVSVLAKMLRSALDAKEEVVDE